MNFPPQGQATGFSCQGFEVRSQGKGSRRKAGRDNENGYHGVVTLRKSALNFLSEAVLNSDALGVSLASVIDHAWLGELCRGRSIPFAGVFGG
jgi:hypothetical protein